jgi:hypothetical protein
MCKALTVSADDYFYRAKRTPTGTYRAVSLFQVLDGLSDY